MQIVGTSGDAPRAVDAVDLTGPTVLVLGNEAEGLTPGYRDLCDLLVGVPMQAGADSVNVACAAAIALYEADRQRRAHPARSTRMRGHRRRGPARRPSRARVCAGAGTGLAIGPGAPRGRRVCAGASVGGRRQGAGKAAGSTPAGGRRAAARARERLRL